MEVKTGIGQDSHKFVSTKKEKPLILGGIIFEGEKGLEGNSDADVVLHSITNAISGITGKNILGEISDKLCMEKGITDSKIYLKEALKYLKDYKITHLSISIECKKPKITPKIPEMKKSIAKLLNIKEDNIGITATSGEELTAFGQGKGIQVFSIVSAIKGKNRKK